MFKRAAVAGVGAFGRPVLSMQAAQADIKAFR